MTTSVHVAQVTKRYGSVTVLDDVSFALGVGVTALLGPNGAGKSTLLRLLSTASAPDDGQITVLGRRCDGPLHERTEIRRRLGFLPQEVNFPAAMTAFGFLDYIAVLKEWDQTAARHAEVHRVLTVVGLDDRPTIKIRKLSGGQRRRLAFAQSLLGDPELLILDEPTTGLDPEQRATLRAVLSDRGRKSTVLLATHQTEDVAALCDRVLVLVGGRVAYDGTVDSLVASAQDQVWVADRSSDNAVATWRDPSGRVRSVGGTPPPGAESATPSVEDAYLLLVGPRAGVGAL